MTTTNISTRCDNPMSGGDKLKFTAPFLWFTSNEADTIFIEIKRSIFSHELHGKPCAPQFVGKFGGFVQSATVRFLVAAIKISNPPESRNAPRQQFFLFIFIILFWRKILNTSGVACRAKLPKPRS